MKKTFIYTAILILSFLLLSSCAKINSKITSLDGLSPVEVVTLHWMAKRANDNNIWLSTLTDNKKAGFVSYDYFQETGVGYGLLSFKINRIYEASGEHREECIRKMLEYEQYKDIDPENMATVIISYTVSYDGKLVFYNDGDITWSYWLFREDESSPWLIDEWGYGVIADIYAD